MITSKNNALIKQVRSLADKKFRDGYNLYVAEGVKLVKEALASNHEVQTIIGTEKGLSQIFAGNVRVETVSEEVFSSVSTEKTPQGVIAIIKKPDNTVTPPKGRSVMLDEVSDPANVGAIIRTAAACGVEDVYLLGTCADAYSPKSIRASSGGIFRVRTHVIGYSDVEKVINQPIYAADMGGTNVYDFKAEKEHCLVIGNEGNGISEFIKKKADSFVSIPMENGMESLNAAVSAGILIYLLKNSDRRF